MGEPQVHRSRGSVPEQSSHRVGAAVDFEPNPEPDIVMLCPSVIVPLTDEILGAACATDVRIKIAAHTRLLTFDINLHVRRFRRTNVDRGGGGVVVAGIYPCPGLIVRIRRIGVPIRDVRDDVLCA